METQKIPNSQINLDKEEQIWKYPIYWFQLYYKATAKLGTDTKANT